MKHPAIYAAITAVITCVLTGALCIAVCVHYTNDATKKAVAAANANTAKSQRVWCALVITLDDAYHSSTPTSPIGEKLADAITVLRHGLGC